MTKEKRAYKHPERIRVEKLLSRDPKNAKLKERLAAIDAVEASKESK